MSDIADEPLSIAAAARAIGVNKSTLARQLKGSPVRFHEGKVRLSEVLAFRAANIDLTRSGRRDGRLDDLDEVPGSPEVDATPPRVDATIEADATVDATLAEDSADVVMVDGAAMSYADARALKETYLARLKRLEFETKRGELAPVGDMVAFAERMFSTVRERLLTIPGKLAGDLNHDQVERVRSELYEAMEELSDPRCVLDEADALPRPDGDGDEIDEASPSPRPRRMGRSAPARGAEDQRRPG